MPILPSGMVNSFIPMGNALALKLTAPSHALELAAHDMGMAAGRAAAARNQVGHLV